MNTQEMIEQSIVMVEGQLRDNIARAVSTREYFGAMADCDAQHGLFKQGNTANRISLEARLANLQRDLRVAAMRFSNTRDRIYALETRLGLCGFRECQRCHEFRIELESLYPRYRRLSTGEVQPRGLIKVKRKLLQDRHRTWFIEYGRYEYCYSTSDPDNRWYNSLMPARLAHVRRIVERYERLADRHGVKLENRVADIRHPTDDETCQDYHKHLSSGEACTTCGTVYYIAPESPFARVRQ